MQQEPNYKQQMKLITPIIDKIRYAGDLESEKTYVKQLLNMFDPDSGEFKYGPPQYESKGETITCNPRRIVCAANRYGDIVVTGARHCDAVMRDTFKRLGGLHALRKQCEHEEQGFIDQYCTFWDRTDAMNIVKLNGQVLFRPIVGSNSNRLYSEHLY